jgi:DNA-binding transcriptional ArsR family regulator
MSKTIGGSASLTIKRSNVLIGFTWDQGDIMELKLSFDANRAAALLGLLSNESRLQVLQLISQREWDVGSLAAKTELSQSALSQHLKKMRDLKVVRTRRDSQTIYYSCTDADVARVLATLGSIFETKVAAKTAA